VFNRAFGVIGRNFVTFFGLGVLAAIPNLLLTLVVFGTTPAAVAMQGKSPSAVLGVSAWLMAIGLVTIAISFVLSAALAHGTYADLSGRRASLGNCLLTGAREFLPLMGITFLSVAALIPAMLLLIVPGIILALAWSVVVPVRVVERVPVFDTFGRSAALTRGHRWAIFGLFVVIWFGSIMLGAMIAPITTGAAFGTTHAAGVAGLLIQSAVGALTSVVTGTIVASIYYELRAIKEGVGPEQLAAVFD
jgi:hypothetical protein